MKKEIVIATRGSKLALWQAEYIRKEIENHNDNVLCKFEIIKTMGDKILDVPLAKIGGKGLFVKEIEVALLSKKADLAVHSMKDVPMDLPNGLELFESPKCEEPNDAFLSIKYNKIEELPKGAKVGTSSLRRKLQILEIRPDLEILDLRGNVLTRLQKLKDGIYDAIILAYAGLKRLELTDNIKEILPVEKMIPASCQGILGIEIRNDDNEIKNILSCIGDKDSYTRAICERAFLRKLQGGCQIPIACHSVLQDDKIKITGVIYNLVGSKKIKKEYIGSKDNPENAGITLAEMVLASGGNEILKEIYQ